MSKGYFKPCWSCKSTGPCYSECECAKCLDPDGYQEWREENPEEYEEWVDSQREYDECDDDE